MISLFRCFLVEEQGQDLIEYTLLLAFVALVGAAIFIGAGTATSNIWEIGNARLNQAASAAS